LIDCLTNGGHAGTVAEIVADAVEHVLTAENERRSKRKCNVSPDVDLTEKVDANGRRRYRLAAINDEPVMVPDIDGFWTPVNQKIK